MDRLLKRYSKFTSKGLYAESILESSAVRSAQPLIEIKHRIGKSTQRFNLENWHHSPDLVVGRWVAAVTQTYTSPAGAYSWGVWWKNENIGAYRVHDPFGNLMAYRLDILKDVTIAKTDNECQLEFTDLIVDVWMWPHHRDEKRTIGSGDVSVEDLGELDASRESGHVSMEDCYCVNNTLDRLLTDPNAMVMSIDSAIEAAVRLKSQEEDLRIQGPQSRN